jgi:hypothetical protein
VSATRRWPRRPSVSSRIPPFALPRVNVAWNIRGGGTSVLRGGYGTFVNRPMGNVDYGPALFVPPNAYNVGADAFYDPTLGGQGLTYDTVRLIPFSDLIGTQFLSTPTPRSFTFPTSSTRSGRSRCTAPSRCSTTKAPRSTTRSR